MHLIPAIDIRNGKCVQLKQGDFERETVYGVDPVAMAQHWHSQGARRLHIVDLDAAKEGRPVNDAVIRRIVTLLRGEVSVQVAGGVRDHNAIHRWVDSGADRIVIGTLAVEHPEVIEHAMNKHQSKIAVAIDAREGKAAVKGWQETSDTPVDDFIRDMTRRGVRHFIYTDIARDGMLQHLDFSIIHHLLEVLGQPADGARPPSPAAGPQPPSPADGARAPSPAAPVHTGKSTTAPDNTGVPPPRPPADAPTLIYSGGVTSIEDVIALNEHPLEGVIIGTALYDGRIDLPTAKLALATGDGTA